MKRTANHNAEINETIIAQGVQVRGNLTVQAGLWLDGEVDGNIQANSDINLGAAGSVNGNIRGGTVVIGGTVKGNVKATVKLIILGSGQVLGDVDVAGLAVEDGGVLIGQVRMPEPTHSETERLNDQEN